MKIRATISIDIVRADGTVSAIADSYETTAGDNPRFENYEIRRHLDDVIARIAQRFPSDEKPLNGMPAPTAGSGDDQ